MTENILQQEKKNRLFLLLGFFFLSNAIIAEMIGTKIFSLEDTLGLHKAELKMFGGIFNFDLTAGVLLWPVVFIMTDIINEYFGRKGVLRLSLITVGMLIYVFITVYLAMGLKGATFWINSQQGAGLANMSSAFNAVFGQGLFIILGSLVAFLVGQVVDAAVFTLVRKKTGQNLIWLRATGSTIVSQFIDSYVVLFIAFYIGADWPLMTVLMIGTGNYIYKLLMALILLPVLYPVHNVIDRYLGKELSKRMMQDATR
jgi:uncharacterized integral membrane protein (TIGR00697 family)